MHRPTKEEIRALPIYDGLALIDIHLIENEQDAADALAVLHHETKLGFDTETKPTFRKGEASHGPTLIQLATLSKAFLFPMRFPAAVSSAHVLLSNPNIKKVGFGIRDDIKELRNKLAIEMMNTQDLSIELKHLVNEKNNIGARAAVAMVLNLRLTKGAQTSNWGAYPLQKHQIQYAASDAHAAICVANALESLQKD